jgi:CRP-like cAMP-binding protein
LLQTLESTLSSHERLEAEDVHLLHDSLTEVHAFSAGAKLWPGGLACKETDSRAIAVLSGWVARQVLLADGRRQIIAIVLPGEIFEPQDEGREDMTYAALGPVRAADASGLAAALGRPELSATPLAAAWRGARREADNAWIPHVLRLGRLSAYERVASLLVELYQRQARAGLASNRSMPLPLTQEALSDILGLSGVHVNRILQQLRRDRLIEYRNGHVTFPHLQRLMDVSPIPGKFDHKETVAL